MNFRFSNPINDRTWHSKVESINLVSNLITEENIIDASSFSPSEETNITDFSKQGAWIIFKYFFEGHYYKVFIFKKRIIVQMQKSELTNLDLSREQPLDSLIRTGIYLSPIGHRVVIAVVGEIYPTVNVVDIRSHLIMVCGSLNREAANDVESGWIDDGITTFFSRVYDSYSNKFGYFRVSRHLSMTFNLSNQLIQDFVNIVYENFLYKEKITKEDVFSIFDSLSKYVLPTEVNLYLQKIFYFLAIFAVVSGVFIALVQDLSLLIPYLSTGSSLLALFLKYLLTLVGLVTIWLILSKVVRKHFRF